MTLDSATLLYTYISRFSVTPHYIKSGRVAATNAVPQPFLIAVSTSRTNGPRLLSRVKAGTHSPSPTGSYTAAYTPKHGRFGRGWYHYPRSVLRGSETLRGQVSERQTLPLWDLGREVLSKNAESHRDSDALMRVAAPRRRGPAGLRNLFSFLSKLRFSHSVLRAFRVCET